MIRHTLAIAALLVSAPATAQSAQDELDARYDRALAAGYKALMLCSAISNAERNGATRTPESVMAWELAGIQAPLDAIMHDLPYRIVRGYAQVVPDEKPDVGSPSEELVYFDIHHVEVDWDNTSPPRFAEYHEGKGCMLGPIGTRKEQPENFIQILPYAEPRPEILSTCTPADEPKFRRNFSASVVGIADRALNGAYGQGSRTTAVVVVRNDQFLEKYADGFEFNTPQRTWSVAKSIAATLVGAAVQRGDVKPRFGLGIWSDVRRGIEIDHALRMASGLYSDTPGNRTDALYFGGATVDEVVPTWPLFNRPGTVFRYANNDTLLAVKAISQGFAAHPPSELFAKLDMNHTVAETDWRGSYILSSQVWSTARPGHAGPTLSQ